VEVSATAAAVAADVEPVEDCARTGGVHRRDLLHHNAVSTIPTTQAIALWRAMRGFSRHCDPNPTAPRRHTDTRHVAHAACRMSDASHRRHGVGRHGRSALAAAAADCMRSRDRRRLLLHAVRLATATATTTARAGAGGGGAVLGHPGSHLPRHLLPHQGLDGGCGGHDGVIRHRRAGSRLRIVGGVASSVGLSLSSRCSVHSWLSSKNLVCRRRKHGDNDEGQGERVSHAPRASPLLLSPPPPASPTPAEAQRRAAG